jgi:hypothetical protein
LGCCAPAAPSAPSDDIARFNSVSSALTRIVSAATGFAAAAELAGAVLRAGAARCAPSAPAANSAAANEAAKIATRLVLRMLVLCCVIGLVFAGTDATSRLSECYTDAASAVFASGRNSYLLDGPFCVWPHPCRTLQHTPRESKPMRLRRGLQSTGRGPAPKVLFGDAITRINTDQSG